MSAHSTAAAPIVAVLGPTNTGKTHLAIDRMLAHSDGVIGLPLRLLAREVYDKVVAVKGAAAAALVTGEERIAPATARYFVCTAEAMPLDRRFAFLAVDEIQLATDPDRGHVFTDRLLHARGHGETMLLGSDVMRPLVRRLLPRAHIERRERFSTLSYAGPRKITKLPKRSAIVAFSAEEVYAIAEVIRRQRGGAAVVMGALSPRTRNAQAALYQSGEVDFLVATDAIGMGLNLDVDHVAFAGQAKFDGHRRRVLRPEETAQIAGRAGRFRNDGTFGETADCPPFDEETIERVENHEFEPAVAAEWRNRDLDFATLPALLRSLAQPPDRPGLMRVRGAVDEEALKRVALDPDIADLAAAPAQVRRLWEVCQIPDYRKVTVDEHARLVATFAKHLLGPGRLPADWVAREVARLDRIEGDLDTLQARLAHVRTWTYAAQRADWLDDSRHWMERTRAIEDTLSDALHVLLTQRFIDRRTSVLMRRLRDEEVLSAGVAAAGEVTVEGHFVGRLHGLDFRPDPQAAGREGRAVRNAALKALGPEVSRRLDAIAAAEDSAFQLHGDSIRHGGAPVARLSPGAALLRPQVELIGGQSGNDSGRRRAAARIEAWLAALIARDLAPLKALSEAGDDCAFGGGARGLAFRMIEAGGALDRRAAPALTREERAQLMSLGVRFGRHTIYAPRLLRPRAVRLLAALRGRGLQAPRGALSVPLRPGLDWADFAAAGFRPCGRHAVAIEAVERLAGTAARAAQGRVFTAEPGWARLIGGDAGDLDVALRALGYRRAGPPGPGPARWRLPHLNPGRTPVAPANPANPFDALPNLLAERRGSGAGS